ncbi:sporulation inhibitor of replication protein SirA [Neobacillus sp. PS3-34]|nr:sporulation inhibitor of replication protein SirA [Neobacillus sp. PS3-34]WML50509.1 sporulation inhibitor of replication protein SirA [Neobacillus sp. PS3-34]
MYSIEINGNLSLATMELREDSIIVEGVGSYEAETVFFEVLRKCEASFLAVDLEKNRFGWLKPIKERKFV